MKIQQVIDFVEDYSKPGFQAMWSFVVNVMRPFSSGMGLRVATLSPRNVELVIPNWLRNKDDQHLHEATYLTAAKEGLRLWTQRLLSDSVVTELKQIQIRNFHSIESDARVCFEMQDSEKEIFLHQLQQKQTIDQTFTWLVFNDSDMKCAEVELKLNIQLPALLETKPQKKTKKNKETSRVRN
jgi:hypothetical protein